MPIQSFQLDIRVPPQIVAERLRAVVQPPSSLGIRMWSARDPSHPFIGTVRDGSFKIYRAISKRNSFLPIVRGRMVATPRGTRVKVTMSISLFSAIFVVACFGVIAHIISASNPDIPRIIADPSVFFVGLGFMFVLAAMVGWGFFPEATKARELLTRAVFDPTISELER
jgi:hypothetical protein